ncbi:MAG: hypothetical protein ABII22_05720 [Candidatus Micrarchaeota archaeon]
MGIYKSAEKHEETNARAELLNESIIKLNDVRTQLIKIPVKERTPEQQVLVKELSRAVSHFERMKELHAKGSELDINYNKAKEEFASTAFGAKYMTSGFVGFGFDVLTLGQLGLSEGVREQADMVEKSLKGASTMLKKYHMAVGDYISALSSYTEARIQGDSKKADKEYMRTDMARKDIVFAVNRFDAEMERVGSVMTDANEVFKVSRDFLVDAAATVATAGTLSLLGKSTKLASLADKGWKGIAAQKAVAGATEVTYTRIGDYLKGQEADWRTAASAVFAFGFAGNIKLPKGADEVTEQLIRKTETSTRELVGKLLDGHLSPRSFLEQIEKTYPELVQRAIQSARDCESAGGTKAGIVGEFTSSMVKDLYTKASEVPAGVLTNSLLSAGKRTLQASVKATAGAANLARQGAMGEVYADLVHTGEKLE